MAAMPGWMLIAAAVLACSIPAPVSGAATAAQSSNVTMTFAELNTGTFYGSIATLMNTTVAHVAIIEKNTAGGDQVIVVVFSRVNNNNPDGIVLETRFRSVLDNGQLREEFPLLKRVQIANETPIEFAVVQGRPQVLSTSSGSGDSVAMLAGICGGVGALMIAVLAFIVYYNRRKNKPATFTMPPLPPWQHGADLPMATPAAAITAQTSAEEQNQAISDWWHGSNVKPKIYL